MTLSHFVVVVIGFLVYGTYAVQYKDLIDTSQPETFSSLTDDDFNGADDFHEADVKNVIRDELQRNGQQMSAQTENYLNNPIQSSGKFEGDIELPANTASFSHDNDYSDVAYNAIRNNRQLWPNGVIPYLISSQIGEYGRKIIASSIADYQKFTCMKVIPRTNEQDYVVIKPRAGCFSTIGRGGGAQTLSLPPACLHKHTIIHEFMHAAGFYHEQARYDRDSHVTIVWKNIMPGLDSQFSKQNSTKTTLLGTQYDQGSVMHYPADAFSRFPNQGVSGYTIIAKNGKSIGNRKGFSDNDIVKINKLYGCDSDEKTTKKPVDEVTTEPTPKPTEKPKTTKKPADSGCSFRSNSRGPYRSMDMLPSRSKEHCCKVCKRRRGRGCVAMTWQGDGENMCWLHTRGYEVTSCNGCFFAAL